ncbi:hypothetical protein EDC01DRAFT_49202 [Geopyxis carbonaria]|nr:hypothetical protein EDC01DRAFT_49202 [Geopyxis carbonaria]
MEEFSPEPTQQATQPLPDHNGIAPSDSTGEDYAGIICFLHPCSAAAIAIVEHTKRVSPGLVVRLPVPQMSNDSNSFVDSDSELTQVDSVTGKITAIDLALRYSPGPKEPQCGFIFGRNAFKCDVLLKEKETTRRISNLHFRIYVNNKGALMLEDMSTNGTWVDDTKLCKDGADGRRRVLSPGSIIFLCPGHIDDLIRFIVRIPKANGAGLATDALEASPLVGIDPGHPGPPPQFRPPQIAGPGAAIISPQRNIAALRRNPFNQRPLDEQHGHRLGQNQFGPPLRQPLDTHTTVQPSGIAAWGGDKAYSLEGEIGKGAFATVSKAYERRTGDVVAVKIIAKRTFATQIGPEKSGVKKEVDILEKLQHPNIVKYINYYEDNTHIYVVMEYIAHGDLNTYLNENITMPEHITKEVVHQVLRGIEYIHAMGISHRDLKPDNILIAERTPIQVKISDFGLAKMVQNEETFLKTFCGTMLYLAPEVFPGYMSILMDDAYEAAAKRKRLPVDDDGRGRRIKDSKKQPRRPYNQAVDMWSLGCVVYALLCGTPPFEGKNQDDMCRLVLKGVFDEDRLRRHVGKDNNNCVDFIRKLLQVKPEMRIMEQEALRHPWIDESGSSVDFDEGEVPGVRYDSEGFPILGSQMNELDEDQEDEDEDVSSGDDNLPTPSVRMCQDEPELQGGMAEMKVGQGPPFESSPEGDLITSSIGDLFESAINSTSEGLSVINRHKDSAQGSSGVLPHGLSMFAADEIANYREADLAQTGLASSCALGDETVTNKSLKTNIQSNPQLNLHFRSDASSLNGAESGLNKLNFAPATPLPKTWSAEPSFSFSNAAPNFSPDSLHNVSPQNASQPRLRSKFVPVRPAPGDDDLPDTQLIFSRDNSSFVMPPMPWGKLIPLPGSQESVIIPLVDQQFQIGRSENSTWRAEDVRISKHHVAFQINHPSAPHQNDHRKSRIGEWKPDANMVVTFHVQGQSGILVNESKFRRGESGMLCNGDRILLFSDPETNEFIGFTAELTIGLVEPEDRNRFAGVRRPDRSIDYTIQSNSISTVANGGKIRNRLNFPDVSTTDTHILEESSTTT